MDTRFPIHVRTVTGLENLLASELKSLGATHIEAKKRVVTCQGDMRFLYAANLWARTAIRVLRPIASFPAPDEKHFYDGVRAVEWEKWMRADGTLAVDANVHSSFTTHSLFIAQLTKDAIVDQFRDKQKVRPSVDLKNPDLRIVVSLYRDQGQIFVDASGESLHRRGYRKEAGEAPLNETLAAGIIQHAGWNPSRTFFDPMCGSGTLLIEAAMMAKNFAPGLLRAKFGFQSWSDYDDNLFQLIVSEAREAIHKTPQAPILGIDRDLSVIAIAKENIRRAQLEGWIEVSAGDFFSSEIKTAISPGHLVMNPPYDERLSVENIAAFYQSIGDRLSEKYSGWNASVLSGNEEAIRCIGLKINEEFELFNGSIECRLLKYDLTDATALAKRKAWRERKPEENSKWKDKAETLANRLRKNYKHLSKWAKREGITSFRVYDRDIPELAFVIDLFDGRMHFAEVPRNHDHTPLEHAQYLEFMLKSAAEALEVSSDKVFFKKRTLQKDERTEPSRDYFTVSEGGLNFFLNLKDFVDVGLHLDQRKLRELVRKNSQGKSVLNLYGYTGSLSVYAAAGGARSTITVDSSSSNLDWAFENFKANGLESNQHQMVRSDVMEFLQADKGRYDLIIVDPPNRSMNRATGKEFDLQRDAVDLVKLLVARLNFGGGQAYFLSHYRTFDLKPIVGKLFPQMKIDEITSSITPTDFEKKLAFRGWKLEA